MIFFHHDWRIEIADSWWSEAGMGGFEARRPAYRPQPNQADIVLVALSDIEPVRRSLSHGVFNDNAEQTAQARVVSILRGFRLDKELPPVEVVRSSVAALRPYKLTAGVHRLYCSLAAGFTHVPAIEGFDLAAFDARHQTADHE